MENSSANPPGRCSWSGNPIGTTLKIHLLFRQFLAPLVLPPCSKSLSLTPEALQMSLNCSPASTLPTYVLTNPRQPGSGREAQERGRTVEVDWGIFFLRCGECSTNRL